LITEYATPPGQLTRKLYWKYALFFTIIYTLSGFFCIFQLSVPPDNYSLLWIPSGLGVIMFFLFGYSAIIWVLIGSFILNSFTYFQHHFTHLEPYRLFLCFLNAALDVLQAFIAWKIALTLEKTQKHPLFSRNNQLIYFFLFVCILPSILTSGLFIFVKTITRPEAISLAIFLKLSIYLTVGNTIGILLIAPIYWAIKLRQGNSNINYRFPIVITIAITSILLLSFYQFPAIVFIIIPLLILLARKGNLLYSIIVSFLTCILLSVGTANRLGFFGTHIDSETSFETSLFLLTIMFVLYIATIVFSELKLHQEKLQMLVTQSISSKEVSEERYRMLAENVADVIWVWDLSLGKFTYISPSVFQLRGLTVEEAMMESIDSSLEPSSARKVLEKIAFEIKNLKNQDGEKKYFYDELQQYKKDGTLIWIETVTHVVFNNHGQLEIIGASRNINKRKIVEELQKENERRLKELNATKDKFFSIIAHDLMNPFHTLIGFSSLLISQTSKKDLDGVLVSAKLMQDAAGKTRNLLKNLLEWSYTQTGNISFNPENLDLNSIMQEVLGLLQVTAEQKGIEVNIEIPGNGIVYSDKNMLSTILRNLISNAVKYTYSGGRINISAEKNETEWLFKVKDNGLGMPPEVYKNIFEIGAHHSELGTEKEEGSGLGLILCKEFVERHHGKIWVESKLREGSTFSFTIPF
jgi:PAS domain S-box-containing protein